MGAMGDVPRAVDGRVPGRRGRATRERLLAATAEVLRTTPYRDVHVRDIARESGTSAATFYQYFPDVEAAVVTLADDVARDGCRRLAEVLHRPSWSGAPSRADLLALVDVVLELWEDHQAVLRVLDLGAAEGDSRFADVRSRLLGEVHATLEAGAARGADRAARRRCRPLAGAVVAMLVHVAHHRNGFEFWDVRTPDLREALADVVAVALASAAAGTDVAATVGNGEGAAG